MTRIGSDLDGVLCYSTLDRRDYRPFRMHHYYALCTPCAWSRMHDFIVTGRKEHFRKVTEEWLQKHGVKYGQLIMFPNKTRKNNRTLAEYKARVINEMKITLYYEDDLKIAEHLKENCPDTKIILVKRMG